MDDEYFTQDRTNTLIVVGVVAVIVVTFLIFRGLWLFYKSRKTKTYDTQEETYQSGSDPPEPGSSTSVPAAEEVDLQQTNRFGEKGKETAEVLPPEVETSNEGNNNNSEENKEENAPNKEQNETLKEGDANSNGKMNSATLQEHDTRL